MDGGQGLLLGMTQVSARLEQADVIHDFKRGFYERLPKNLVEMEKCVNTN
jgi:hypothetical protein